MQLNAFKLPPYSRGLVQFIQTGNNVGSMSAHNCVDSKDL